MSPEQAEGKPTDTRSDVFSFGSVLYEMVTGRRAFDGETKMSTLAAILERDPKPPSEVNPAGAARSRESHRTVSPEGSRATLAVDGGSEGRARGGARRSRITCTPLVSLVVPWGWPARRLLPLLAASIAAIGVADVRAWWWSRPAPRSGPRALH